MTDMKYVVEAEWDDEAKVYVVTSDDVPGLVAEAKTLDAIRDKVLALVPELLHDNAHLLSETVGHGSHVRFCLESPFSFDCANTH